MAMVASFNLRFGAGAMAVAALGCSTAPGASSSGDRTGEAAAAIIGGTASPSAQDAVVLLVLRLPGATGSCTGTLVANNVVLTAWHCVSTMLPGGVLCDEQGNQTGGGSFVTGDITPSDILVFTGTTKPTSAELGRPQARGRKAFHPDGRTVCGRDVALLVLDRSVQNAHIAPVRLDRLPDVGEAFTAVGWGVTSGGSPAVRQQRAGLRVLARGPLAVRVEGDGLPASDWEAGESVCAGDSGGPALAEGGAVVGVVSRGGNSKTNPTSAADMCSGDTARAVYSGLAAHASLFTAAFAEAQQDTWVEGGEAPAQTEQAPPAEADADLGEVAEPEPTRLPAAADGGPPQFARSFEDERHVPPKGRCAAGAVGAATDVANAVAIAIAIAAALAARRRARAAVPVPVRVRPPGRGGQAR